MNERDYKYVMQDISSTQLGARYTYEDLLSEERVPFKLQSLIRIYVLRETDPQLELGQHVCQLQEGSLVLDVYKQLKMKVRFYEPKQNGEGFTSKQMKLEEFVLYAKEHWKENSMVYEIAFSNLALMAFSI